MLLSRTSGSGGCTRWPPGKTSDESYGRRGPNASGGRNPRPGCHNRDGRGNKRVKRTQPGQRGPAARRPRHPQGCDAATEYTMRHCLMGLFLAALLPANEAAAGKPGGGSGHPNVSFGGKPSVTSHSFTPKVQGTGSGTPKVLIKDKVIHHDKVLVKDKHDFV